MLFKKMLRDMKEHKMQFVAIFLMSFITLLAFAGIGSEVQGLQDNLNNYYNETNMADAYVLGSNFNKTVVNDFKNLSSTTGIETQFVVKSIADLEDEPTVTLHFLKKNKISKYYPVEGKKINFSDADGIWLDARFAEAKNLTVGDNISVKFNGITLNKTIRGLGYSPDYVYEQPENGLVSDFKYQGFGYLSEKAYPGEDMPHNKLLLTTNATTPDYYHQTRAMLEDKGYDDIINGTSFMPREDSSSDDQIQDEIKQHIVLAVMFPIIFVVVALLILLTTMTRIVNQQRTQIGTLKAIGFENRPLILHYLSYGFYLTLIGSVLGIIVGHNTIPYIFVDTMKSYYTLPCWNPGFNISFIIVALLIVLGSVLCSYFAVASIIREPPSVTLKAKPPKVSKIGFIENTWIWNKMGFNLRWNTRDVNRHKLRTLIALVGVIGCTVLLISAFGMQDGVNDLKTWKYDDINHYETQLVLDDNVSQSQIDSIIKEVNGTPVMTKTIQIEANGIKKMQVLTVHDKSPLITPTDKDRQEIKLPKNGISISEKTAEIYGLKVGDKIKWHLYGNETWISSTVKDIYGDPSVQGITITKECAEKNNISFKPTEIVTAKNVTGNLDGVGSYNSHKDLTNSWDKLSQTANLLIIILVIFAVILAIVVLYSLGLLGFTEVERDMATLKVLGFQLSDLRKLFITQYLGISIVGFIIGVPTGYYVLEAIRSNTDKLYYPTDYSLTTIAISFVITIIVSAIVNLLLANQLKNIDMVEALKKERE
ncbi:ABC transporter permease [Methanobrevibacter sp.]|uniref:ABC transporter permease n=1 Tax=Methanobrevibacter sp. TaxID=66852 RepID=UPI00386FEAD8